MAASLIPHSFVLADLFEIVSMSLDVPDHVHENEPGLELVPCPECDGEGWLECYGSAYGASCNLWGRPDLNFTLKPCPRCHCEREILDITPIGLESALTLPSLSYRLAA